MNIIDEIREMLLECKDDGYRLFQSKLIPDMDPDRFIGVRTPELKRMSRELAKREDISSFLDDLPHRYFDEDQIHAFIISDMKDYDGCLKELGKFLPHIDNWATCDQLSPKAFRKQHEKLMKQIDVWLRSSHAYTVRFAIRMLMNHFLDEDFDERCLEKVASVRSEEYYIRMMVAWYFATALAKRYEESVVYLKERKLDVWTHNKTIQKALESFRIADDKKDYLRTLRIRG